MEVNLVQFNTLSQKKSGENRKFLLALKKKDARKVDDVFHAQHNDVFENTNCLTCANCCKTTSPIFYQNDIERVAKSLRMKPGDFVEKYLRIDEDNDYVLKSSPCPFLGADNFCSIYEVRPSDCARFPYTDEDVLLKRQNLTLKNASFCPIVFYVLDKLTEIK